jgi:hypothetical protein
LLAAFQAQTPTGLDPAGDGDEEDVDSDLGPEGRAAKAKLAETRDAALEELKDKIFAVDSQDAMYARYKRYKKATESEQLKWAELSAPDRKKRVAEWAKGEYAPYEDF